MLAISLAINRFFVQWTDKNKNGCLNTNYAALWLIIDFTTVCLITEG